MADAKLATFPGPIQVTQISQEVDVEAEEGGECELFGFFGIFIQFLLALICTASLVVKKFLPGETRTWKVFCLDIWKQLFTAGFAHFLNLVLAVYLQQLTREGNGCVWYLVTLLCDTTLGVFFAYVFFKIVDEIAIKFDIEVSKTHEDGNFPILTLCFLKQAT